MAYSAAYLQELWKKKKEIFARPENQWIIKRLRDTKRVVDDLLDLDLNIDREKGEVTIGGEKLQKNGTNEFPIVSEDVYYAVAADGYPDNDRRLAVQRLVADFPSQEKRIRDTACLLGGNDYENRDIMKEEFRLLSCSQERTGNDNGSLSCSGLPQKISSHFFTNNYFFEIAQLLKDLKYADNPKDIAFHPEISRLVLHYPPNASPEDVTAEDVEIERDVLRHRFPYKFFFMWANQDKLIHLPSLMAYQNLVRRQDDLAYADPGVKQDIEDFISSNEGWPEFTKNIVKLITGEDIAALSPQQRSDLIAELSKFISILVLNNELRLASKLLEGGCQAIILQGPPGTGKTYMAKTIAGEFLGVPYTAENQAAFNALQFKGAEKDPLPKAQGQSISTSEAEGWEQPGAEASPGAWELVQFHPAYVYEDFIGGISPSLNQEKGTISYTLKEGKFKVFCDYAREQPKAKFIFIIDEINRGDISSIFGELMYALEYRGEEISIPNFPEKFSIPPNVYLIGTMNTLDKGIATMDIAMRRRFGFHTLPPNLNALFDIFKGIFKKKYDVNENYVEIENIADYISRCEKLNSQLMLERDFLGIGEDHTIGQAFFAKITDFGDIEAIETEGVKKIEWKITRDDRANLWLYHLQPLLEEYLGSRKNDEFIKQKLEELRKAFVDEA